MEKFQQEQDEFEKENLGRYEKIFPLPVSEAQKSNQNTQDDPTLTER